MGYIFFGCFSNMIEVIESSISTNLFLPSSRTFPPFTPIILILVESRQSNLEDSDDKSYAYFKRWLILSFDRVFQGITKDTNLINKLTTPNELSGLLNLALIALRQLKKDCGFRDISVEKVRKEYEYNSNTVKAFIDDKCDIDLTSPEYCIPTVYLYNEYENFCQEKGVRELEVNTFGSKLKEYGIEKDRKRNHGDRE
jgi:putative DNA primase/helicase